MENIIKNVLKELYPDIKFQVSKTDWPEFGDRYKITFGMEKILFGLNIMSNYTDAELYEIIKEQIKMEMWSLKKVKGLKIRKCKNGFRKITHNTEYDGNVYRIYYVDKNFIVQGEYKIYDY